jgi:outer membrane protein assembly factor BamE (lipoprotein component of BamABCDE complex)
MNTQNVLATITITALLAFATGYATGQQNDGKFTIHKTRSGMFIVDDTVSTMGKGKAEAKIYEVLELPTNQPSFQNEGDK